MLYGPVEPAFRSTDPWLRDLWVAYGPPPDEGQPDTRSAELKAKIVVAYFELNLVQKVVNAHCRKAIKRGSENRYSREDLESYAKEGLLKSVPRYDYRKGFVPATYLSQRIWGATLDAARRMDPLTRSDRAKVQAGEMEEPKCLKPIGLPAVAAEDSTYEGRSLSVEDEGCPREVLLRAFRCPLSPYLHASERKKEERRVVAHVLSALEGFTQREIHAVLTRRTTPSPSNPPWVREILKTAPLRLGQSETPSGELGRYRPSWKRRNGTGI